MQVMITPKSVAGTVTPPASKSAMQRACAAALLRHGKTVLHNPGTSADDKAALRIIQQLGADVTDNNDNITITGKGGVAPVNNTIDCGESGLSSRMFTSIAALSSTPLTITGQGSLLKRPFTFFSDTLPALGVRCSTADGKLPLQVAGPLLPADIEIDGSLSSQFLTGLLFAYAAANAAGVTIRVKDLNSKPYIDLTLQVMQDFGLSVPVNNNYQSFYFPETKNLQSKAGTLEYSVEGDWSGGAFLLVAGAIAGDIVVHGLNVFSAQAHKANLQPHMQSGANISIEEKQIHVRKNRLQPFQFSATDCPDLFPPLVALAAFCDGTSVIEGVNRLTHKESNRALTLQEEFGKMGVGIDLQDDLMIIRGGGEVKGATVHSHHDHRIAMACAVAALVASGEVVIEGAEAVDKSYPAFWQHLQSMGAQLTLNHVEG